MKRNLFVLLLLLFFCIGLSASNINIVNVDEEAVLSCVDCPEEILDRRDAIDEEVRQFDCDASINSQQENEGGEYGSSDVVTNSQRASLMQVICSEGSICLCVGSMVGGVILLTMFLC